MDRKRYRDISGTRSWREPVATACPQRTGCRQYERGALPQAGVDTTATPRIDAVLQDARDQARRALRVTNGLLRGESIPTIDQSALSYAHPCVPRSVSNLEFIRMLKQEGRGT